jgi:hypothetical protein
MSFMVPTNDGAPRVEDLKTAAQFRNVNITGKN